MASLAESMISRLAAQQKLRPALLRGLQASSRCFSGTATPSAADSTPSASTSGRLDGSLPNTRSRGAQWAWRAGAVGLLAATGAALSYAMDDVLTFNKCRSQAMERAANDVRLQKILGDDISSGAWYEGSLGRGHNGQSASCSFPISGSRGTATLQLKAIRFEGGNTLYYNLLGPGRWEVLMLDAEIARPKETTGVPPQGPSKVRINLMQTDDQPRIGDLQKGECLPCSKGDRGLTVA